MERRKKSLAGRVFLMERKTLVGGVLIAVGIVCLVFINVYTMGWEGGLEALNERLTEIDNEIRAADTRISEIIYQLNRLVPPENYTQERSVLQEEKTSLINHKQQLVDEKDLKLKERIKVGKKLFNFRMYQLTLFSPLGVLLIAIGSAIIVATIIFVEAPKKG